MNTRCAQAGHVGRVAAGGVGVRQAEGDPPGEHRTGQRDRDRGDHPQPQLVLAEQRERHREQERQRLPRRRAVGVELPVDRQLAPGQPSVRVIAGAHARPQDHHERDEQQRDRADDPGIATGQRDEPVLGQARGGPRRRVRDLERGCLEGLVGHRREDGSNRRVGGDEARPYRASINATSTAPRIAT